MITSVARDADVPVSLLMVETDAETALQRQLERGRMIPLEAFAELAGLFNKTMEDIQGGLIYEEGFRLVNTIRDNQLSELKSINFNEPYF